jgi:antitoxin (DNA-binding transcriptional repressor) of toxin-antitoxin stability system
MYHIKTATIRDLRYNFKRVERLLAEGEAIQITKRKRVVANLLPPEPPPGPPQMPDFLGRMRKISGDKVFKVSWAELLAQDRDRY